MPEQYDVMIIGGIFSLRAERQPPLGEGPVRHVA